MGSTLAGNRVDFPLCPTKWFLAFGGVESA